MNDDIARDWRLLEPTGESRRRMDRRVAELLDAYDASLFEEWLAIVRVAPVRTVGLVAAGALSMVLATPIMWLARVLL